MFVASNFSVLHKVHVKWEVCIRERQWMSMLPLEDLIYKMPELIFINVALGAYIKSCEADLILDNMRQSLFSWNSNCIVSDFRFPQQ